MNIILWVLSLKRQSTLQALSTPISRFQELLTSLRRALTCLHCHLRNFFRFLEQNKDDKACVTPAEVLSSADRAHSTGMELVFARLVFQALAGIFLRIL